MSGTAPRRASGSPQRRGRCGGSLLERAWYAAGNTTALTTATHPAAAAVAAAAARATTVASRATDAEGEARQARGGGAVGAASAAVAARIGGSSTSSRARSQCSPGRQCTSALRPRTRRCATMSSFTAEATRTHRQSDGQHATEGRGSTRRCLAKKRQIRFELFADSRLPIRLEHAAREHRSGGLIRYIYRYVYNGMQPFVAWLVRIGASYLSTQPWDPA